MDSVPSADHFRDAAHAGVAGIQVVLLVKYPIAGFDELAGSDAHAVADRAEHFAVAIQLQELAILTARHPWVALRIELERANEISHLHRLEEFAVAGVDDDSILLAVADPDVAVCGIDGESMNRIEFSLADTVAIPLVDEFAVLIQMDDARRADIVGRIVGIGIIGALVRMTLADIDIAVPSEGDHHRLP